MKATFNGKCWGCKTFKPGCAKICYHPNPRLFRAYCGDCRKKIRGKYSLHWDHKDKGKA
jgi:hypothetical protein